jgi:hypothetical protein
MATGSIGFWDAFGRAFGHPVDTLFFLNDSTDANTTLSNPNVIDFGVNAVGGKLTTDQLNDIANQTRTDVKAAGGSDVDADAAAAQVQQYYINTYGPPVDTSGFKLGLAGLGGIIVLVLIFLLLHEWNKL